MSRARGLKGFDLKVYLFWCVGGKDTLLFRLDLLEG